MTGVMRVMARAPSFRRVHEFAEAMSILPDASANRNQTDADANISQQINRPLHGIGDGEISVFALR